MAKFKPHKTHMDLEVLAELNRRPALAMTYGASWTKAQEFSDPDLSNPVTIILLEDHS